MFPQDFHLSEMPLNLMFQQAGFVSSHICPSFEEIAFHSSLHSDKHLMLHLAWTPLLGQNLESLCEGG